MSELKKKILLVDDSDLQLAIADNILKNEYEVITAQSGEDALKYLIKGLIPDIILLDVLMPNMDGWETYHKIRGISLLINTPIAFFTSLNESENIKYAQGIGAAGYITKPFEKDELLEKIKDIIEKAQVKK